MAALLRFLVRLMLAAAVTELLELETAGGRLLVLGRRVVPLLAFSALQCDNFPHLLILTDSELRRLFASCARLSAFPDFLLSVLCFSFLT
jgi:hypothetical protein